MATQQKISKIFDNATFTDMYRKVEMMTGPYGQRMIEQSEVLKYAQQHDRFSVLDTACGTGVVSSLLLKALTASSLQDRVALTCADISESMIAATTKRIEANKWPSGTKAIKADALDTGLPADHFNFVFLNFGPALLPSPEKGVAECFRVLVPGSGKTSAAGAGAGAGAGGVFGCTSWVHLPWIQTMNECWEAYPAAHQGRKLPDCPTRHRFMDSFSPDAHNWADPTQVKRKLEQAGFIDVNVTQMTNHTVLDSYHEWMDLWKGSVGMVFNQCWTEADKKEWGDEAAKWAGEWMKNKYGEGQKITWEWRALVTTARKA